MDLAAGDSHPMVLQRERKERKKLEVVVGTTYRWNTAAALPHTAQRFSSMRFSATTMRLCEETYSAWGSLLG